MLQFLYNILEACGSRKGWRGEDWKTANGYQTCQHLFHLGALGLGVPRLWGGPCGGHCCLLPDIPGEGGGNHLGEEKIRQGIQAGGEGGQIAEQVQGTEESRRGPLSRGPFSTQVMAPDWDWKMMEGGEGRGGEGRGSG